METANDEDEDEDEESKATVSGKIFIFDFSLLFRRDSCLFFAPRRLDRSAMAPEEEAPESLLFQFACRVRAGLAFDATDAGRRSRR